jgi:DNA mismatch endonuclease (patch repair protein)
MERHLRLKLENGSFAGVTPVRSSIMAAIKGKSNKSTEWALRSALVRAGIRGWRLHASELPGKPDFYFYDEQLAVFVDGCFWHGCPRCGHIPKTRSAFWEAKFLRNKARDRSTERQLRQLGIRVMRVWEHSLKRQHEIIRIVRRIEAKRQP